jgi:hypothetical protein
MLRWTSEGDKDIRSFAAKVTADLADSLLVVHLPGAMQLIASLLDTVHRQKIKDPLMDIGSLEATHTRWPDSASWWGQRELPHD